MSNYSLKKRDPLSPLRYPGGKALLAAYVSGVIEENLLGGCTLYEPYAGGASVSLELLHLGFIEKAVLIERDPLVYAFWWSVFNDTAALCDAIEVCDVSMETWRQLNPLREVSDTSQTDFTLLQLGIAGLFFNRTNFSGVIGAGPIGGQKQSSQYKIGCRFNKEKIIRQIRYLAKFAGRVNVIFGDAINYLKKNSLKISAGFSFVYVDPPYYLQGKKLYRHFYTDEDHSNLSKFICGQGYPWLMSYDDHPRIRELYADQHMQPIYLDYKVKSSRRAQELVISNLQIPVPIYEGMENLQAELELN